MFTYGKHPDGVDGELVQFSVSHGVWLYEGGMCRCREGEGNGGDDKEMKREDIWTRGFLGGVAGTWRGVRRWWYVISVLVKNGRCGGSGWFVVGESVDGERGLSSLVGQGGPEPWLFQQTSIQPPLPPPPPTTPTEEPLQLAVGIDPKGDQRQHGKGQPLFLAHYNYLCT